MTDQTDEPTITLSHQQAVIVCDLLTYLYDNASIIFEPADLDVLELLHEAIDHETPA